MAGDIHSHSIPEVLILAAGSSRDKMPGFPVFEASPAFMPINSRSLGKLVIDFYLGEKVPVVYLAINEEEIEVAKQEFGCFADKLRLIPIKNSMSLADSVQQSLPFLKAREVILNIVTTIPKVFLNQENCIGIDETPSMIEGWSAVEFTPDGMKFVSKNEAFGLIAHSFSGIFRARKSDIELSCSSLMGDSRRDMICLVSDVAARNPISVVKFSWFDCGRVQNYFKTRTKIFGSRFFNSISVDVSSGILQKKSSNIEKMTREIEYIEGLPSPLKVFFPRVFSTSLQGNVVQVDMEYYAYPTLAEIMLYWDLPASMWRDIFSNLSALLGRFSDYKYSLSSVDWSEIYVKKVADRVFEYQQLLVDKSSLDLFSEDGVIFNGKGYYGFNKLIPLFQLVLPLLNKADDACVIHGDFCFNNILCEPYVGLIKLLDARGSFGELHVGVYGDRKYDWAKWAHSVVGRYDYIVNDLFHLSRDGREFKLIIYDRPWQGILDSLYWETLDKAGFSKDLIKFVMGTLFISMPPLHTDKPSRQIAFYLKGIQFLNESLIGLGFLSNSKLDCGSSL